MYIYKLNPRHIRNGAYITVAGKKQHVNRNTSIEDDGTGNLDKWVKSGLLVRYEYNKPIVRQPDIMLEKRRAVVLSSQSNATNNVIVDVFAPTKQEHAYGRLIDDNGEVSTLTQPIIAEPQLDDIQDEVDQHIDVHENCEVVEDIALKTSILQDTVESIPLQVIAPELINVEPETPAVGKIIGDESWSKKDWVRAAERHGIAISDIEKRLPKVNLIELIKVRN